MDTTDHNSIFHLACPVCIGIQPFRMMGNRWPPSLWWRLAFKGEWLRMRAKVGEIEYLRLEMRMKRIMKL